MSEGRLFPIAIGGGHDLTFPFVRAVIEFWRTRGIDIGSGVYFDAHLDVRDTPGSGMPFRRLIEDCGVNALVNFGPQPDGQHARPPAVLRRQGRRRRRSTADHPPVVREFR